MTWPPERLMVGRQLLHAAGERKLHGVENSALKKNCTVQLYGLQYL